MKIADPRLIVALDKPGPDAALVLAERLEGVVSFFKVGLTLLSCPGGVDRSEEHTSELQSH